ncbi:hypothetical protein [Salipaludibacillus sp. CF4.18]|uniref:hypothetical protein n=1 Tax=Salipaludibacillus sp. CF4.18 TaxID=3373081 RepID=UPI003EE5CC1E
MQLLLEMLFHFFFFYITERDPIGLQREKRIQQVLHTHLKLNRLIEDLFEIPKIDLDQLAMEQTLVNSEEYFTKTLKESEIEQGKSFLVTSCRKILYSVLNQSGCTSE